MPSCLFPHMQWSKSPGVPSLPTGPGGKKLGAWGLLVVPSQSLPLLWLPEPRQRENMWSSSKRARLPEAVEPPRRASLPESINQLSAWDRLVVCDLSTSCVAPEASRGEVGLSRPWDHARVIGSLTCYQPCSPRNPEGEEASRQDMSPIGWKVTVGRRCHQLTSWACPHWKVGDRSSSLRSNS